MLFLLRGILKMKKLKLSRYAFAFLPMLALLVGCGRPGLYEDKVFLHFKYKLENCADVHGQDIYSRIWFSEYKGDSYAKYFNLDFTKSYLDFNVGIDESSLGYGYGHLLVSFADDSKYLDLKFSYYCTMTDTTGGYITSDLPEQFGRFVYCIYWSRLNVNFIVPDTQEEIVLTLHFRGGESNPYPSEFDQRDG